MARFGPVSTNAEVLMPAERVEFHMQTDGSSDIRAGIIAVTGASGFAGSAIVKHLAKHGHAVRALTRTGEQIPGASEHVATGDLTASLDQRIFKDCTAVVHCAARVHILGRDRSRRSEELYEKINAELPVTLAMLAREAGARRFVQISSVAAISSHSAAGTTVSDIDQERPNSPYGRTKLSADLALAQRNCSHFTTVSLRPPALYGPGVGALFGALSRAAQIGLPLPLAGIHNRRSFMFIDNFTSAVEAALHSATSGRFIVTDSEPLSTAELYRQLLFQWGHGDRVWRWPPKLVCALAGVALGRRLRSLVGDAAYDGTRFRQEFGWNPSIPLHEALEATTGKFRV